MILPLLRKIVRIVLILLWMPCNAVWSFFFQLGGMNGVKRVSHCTRLWGRGLAWILGLKITVEGSEKALSQQGGLIVSNHQSYLDILVHAALFPIRFTPKKEIRSWPILGPYLAISRPIWIDRGSKQKSKNALEQFRATLNAGIPLLIYPEGTTTNGRGPLLPFKSTPFEAVCVPGATYTVRPILCIYETPSDQWNFAWYGDQTLLPHVWKILGYRQIKVRIILLDPILSNGSFDRKQLALTLHTQMSQKWHEITGY